MKNKLKSFSLIEIMVSVFILSLVIISIISIINGKHIQKLDIKNNLNTILIINNLNEEIKNNLSDFSYKENIKKIVLDNYHINNDLEKMMKDDFLNIEIKNIEKKEIHLMKYNIKEYFLNFNEDIQKFYSIEKIK